MIARAWTSGRAWTSAARAGETRGERRARRGAVTIEGEWNGRGVMTSYHFQIFTLMSRLAEMSIFPEVPDIVASATTASRWQS